MNHKRKGLKSTRAGCLLCKPWKVMGNRKEALRYQDHKNTERFREQLTSLTHSSLC